MNVLRIALVLALACAGIAAAETAASLERDADGRMERGQYQLAQNLYKLALQRDPKNEFIWVKYDLAHERYMRSVGQGSRATLPREAAHPAPSAAAPAPTPSAAAPRDTGGWNQGGDPNADPSADPNATPSEEPVEPPTPEPPTPEPTPSPPAGSDTLYRSPSELIYLSRPVRAGDTTPVQGGEEGGQQITVRTPHYEIFDIQFVVDPSGSLHVRGKVKNLSTERDFRNPSVYVALFDKQGIQIALKPVRLSNVSAVLFRGESGEFDAAFPKFNTTVGAYRVSLDP